MDAKERMHFLFDRSENATDISNWQPHSQNLFFKAVEEKQKSGFSARQAFNFVYDTVQEQKKIVTDKQDAVAMAYTKICHPAKY